MLVGDIDAIGPDLEAAGLGPLVIERDEVSGAPGATDDEATAPGPLDDEAQTGPTAGAEDTEAAGTEDELAAPTRDPDGEA